MPNAAAIGARRGMVTARSIRRDGNRPRRRAHKRRKDAIPRAERILQANRAHDAVRCIFPPRGKELVGRGEAAIYVSFPPILFIFSFRLSSALHSSLLTS